MTGTTSLAATNGTAGFGGGQALQLSVRGSYELGVTADGVLQDVTAPFLVDAPRIHTFYGTATFGSITLVSAGVGEPKETMIPYAGYYDAFLAKVFPTDP